MADIDLLYFKEKQSIIILDKLNISTLNCKGMRRSKGFIIIIIHIFIFI